jgi:hypothetical protein
MSSLASLRGGGLAQTSVDLSAAAIDAVMLEMKRGMRISATAISMSKRMSSSLLPASATVCSRSASKTGSEGAEKSKDAAAEAVGGGMSARKKEGAAVAPASEKTSDHVTAVLWATADGRSKVGNEGALSEKGRVTKRRGRGKWWSCLVRSLPACVPEAERLASCIEGGAGMVLGALQRPCTITPTSAPQGSCRILFQLLAFLACRAGVHDARNPSAVRGRTDD